MHKRTELSYRLAAIDHSNPLGMMIALYDTLIGDIQRGSEAIRRGDIEARCSELNHAYLVLGQLESWIDPTADPALANSLRDFYSHVRSRIFAAGVTQSERMLVTLVELVLQVRASWQQRESDFRDTSPHAA